MRAEVALAVLIGILSRAVDYFDNLLADRYTHHVSVEVMRKAAALDVTVYEDPVFYDRLERARVQATDRLAMIQQMGRLIQQTVTAIAFSARPHLLFAASAFLLVAGIVPAFLGESHFAFLTYAKNFRQTPVRRQMDYLRQVGGSKEAAKELKLFNLSEYLTGRFTKLSQRIYEENVALNRRRLFWGGLLAIVGQLGYYGAYVYSIYRTIQGRYTIGDLTLITTAIMQAMGNIQQAFSTASGVADQALFLTDLLAFFEMKPTRRSRSERPARAASHHARLRIPQRLLRLSGHDAARSQQLQFHAAALGSAWRSSARTARARPPSSSSSRASTIPPKGRFCSMASTFANTTWTDLHARDRRHLSGLHALRDDGAGKHRRRPGRSAARRRKRLNTRRKKAWPAEVVDEAARRLRPDARPALCGRRRSFRRRMAEAWRWRAPTCAMRNC